MVRGGCPAPPELQCPTLQSVSHIPEKWGQWEGAPETEPESEDEGDGEEYIPGTGWHTVWYLADGTTSYEPPVRVTAVQEI